MDAFITRVEYEEHTKRMEDEHRRMNHRILELEEESKEKTKLLANIEKMATNMEHMQREQVSQGKRLEELEERDGNKWRKAADYVVSAIIGAVVCYFVTQLGM